MPATTHGTGQGQYIDMALLDVGMAVLANQAAGFLATGQAPGRAGNIHPSLAPYQDFPTLDGNVLLAIGNDGQFARFCAAIGQAGWAQDARFATNTARVQNRAALLELMKPQMLTAQHGRLDCAAGRQGRALRPHQHHCPGL
jgi:crotonobetainyl-CoA:carnitine CoA-transferase CaiB-like acyl-CoA transferase